ncbi:MAG: aminomethyl-transferring glycine dehydrogenase [Cyanobacteria bacterium J06632_3]
MSYDSTTASAEVTSTTVETTTTPRATADTSDWLTGLASDQFANRHLGPTAQNIDHMLRLLGFETIEALISAAVPAGIRLPEPLSVGEALSETAALEKIAAIASKNQVYRSYIGLGYHNCVTPAVIQRNILENPGWYTQYTPYQPEISQGRLQALLNYQTMVTDLTGLEIANASLLDEGTAAAEAMSMSFGVCKNKDAKKAKRFWVSASCHPQTIEVIKTRSQPLGIEVVIGDHQQTDFASEGPFFGALLQYPATDGSIYDYTAFVEEAHAAGAIVTVAADLLSLTLLKAPGEFGADIAVGNTQRFGVPLGYGGPHAAYFATKEAYARKLPGRLVGVSKDSKGKAALRLSLQTREQHIRRDSATSNICTAQVLLAIIAGSYAVYHGPAGLKAIAHRTQQLTSALSEGLKKLGFVVGKEPVFDTLTIDTGEHSESIIARATAQQINLRIDPEKEGQVRTLGISLDETTGPEQVNKLLAIFAGDQSVPTLKSLRPQAIPSAFQRTSAYLTHPVFNQYHSETELLRYLYSLQKRDLSLADAMIPLGSCTMKLNATAEMVPITWPEFGQIHPFAPLSQTKGYQALFTQLEGWLANITGFAGISLQPNAGSQGEYTGLLVIRQYHESRGEGHRNICLIPQSAHGTNPASAVMAGMKVVAVKCDNDGNIDVEDLTTKAQKHADNLSALMVTYPSTHGVFEESIKAVCEIVHSHGGQVYMDGANMNAQVGLCSPGDIGADVCHLNLHKTFCIPHGGGGPGVGPIGVAAHLVPFLPGHALVEMGGSESAIGAVSAAPWGSASILPISWMYIQMMGSDGLKQASELAILNANYIAKRLEGHYDILYKGSGGLVAHECIIDLRGFKKTAQVNVDDIAKRMIDYGFHPPTMSWPVAGTIMVEPTESESLSELDRFCDAMIAIREEIRQIEEGAIASEESPLHHAPHTTADLVDDWNREYSREAGVFPTAWTKERKFWPTVNRIDQAFGDRNLVCTCPSMDEFDE